MRAKFNAIMLIAVGLLFATTFTALAADQKEKKAKKPKKERVQYIGTTGVPKADPDVFLSLNGGIFTLNDKSSPSYAVCTQAYDRLPKKFDGKIRRFCRYLNKARQGKRACYFCNARRYFQFHAQNISKNK